MESELTLADVEKQFADLIKQAKAGAASKEEGGAHWVQRRMAQAYEASKVTRPSATDSLARELEDLIAASQAAAVFNGEPGDEAGILSQRRVYEMRRLKIADYIGENWPAILSALQSQRGEIEATPQAHVSRSEVDGSSLPDTAESSVEADAKPPMQQVEREKVVAKILLSEAHMEPSDRNRIAAEIVQALTPSSDVSELVEAGAQALYKEEMGYVSEHKTLDELPKLAVIYRRKARIVVEATLSRMEGGGE